MAPHGDFFRAVKSILWKTGMATQFVAHRYNGRRALRHPGLQG